MKGDSTGSDETLEQIRAWIAQCQTHSHCAEWPSSLGALSDPPSRLIEIHPGSDNPKIRLILRDQLPSQGRRYATLSHCWGGDLPIRLLQENLQSFRDEIPWNLLPRTFREAISTVLKLGIRYIWIDALCIIQNCQNDWAYEAASMAGVYANCFVNISAHASKSGHGGLFRERNLKTLQTIMISGPNPNAEFQACGYTDRRFVDLNMAPLQGRAWVVQERFLAPRVIHFAATQVYWECTQLSMCEGNPFQYESHDRKSHLCLRLPTDMAQRTKIVHKRYELWCDLRRSYSLAKMSFAKDRPAGIAGLARIFCPLLGLRAGDYHCGLWRTSFLQDMAWHCEIPQDHRIDTKTPSWSWLSIGSDVQWQYSYTHYTNGWKDIADVVDVTTISERDNFGSVAQGYVRVRGPLCQATILERPQSHKSSGPTFTDAVDNIGDISLGSLSLWRFFMKLDMSVDHNFGGKPGLTVYLLLLGGNPEKTNR